MKLQRSHLWSLEEYSEKRQAFRAEVIQHKKARQVPLGPHATLYFEDAITMKYQVQEMLRVEKIFTGPEIEEELAAYNPLIPDGNNWKATFMIEYADAEERREALIRMAGIEHKIWIKVGEQPRMFAHANDDLERSNHEKTAAVHFLRFELTDTMISDLKAGAPLKMGIEHEELPYQIDVKPDSTTSLIKDFA